MMEIVFSDSACGSLKMAQGFGSGPYRPGGIGVMLQHEDGSPATEAEIETALREAEAEQRQAWESAVPLGGSSQDVYGFALALSLGDISEEQPGPLRLQALARLYSIYPNFGEEEIRHSLLQPAKAALDEICRRAAEGERVRIWYSHSPDELCGLRWFLAHIHRIPKLPAVSLIRLPGLEVDEAGNIIHRTCWGEVAPGEWHSYLSLEKPTPPAFLAACAAHWQALQAENAPLRAVVNGHLLSVPESFYDCFLQYEIAAQGETFHEAVVIGRVLGQNPLGISDAWLALRIEAMVQDGLLEPVDEAPEDSPHYHRRLQKRQVV